MRKIVQRLKTENVSGYFDRQKIEEKRHFQMQNSHVTCMKFVYGKREDLNQQNYDKKKFPHNEYFPKCLLIGSTITN